MLWRRRPRVEKLASQQDIKRLVAAADYRDFVSDSRGRLHDLGASTRRDAVIAIANVADTNGIDVGASLLKALGDPSGDTRRAAAWALGVRHELRGVDALRAVALGSGEDAEAAADALVTLAEHGATELFARSFIRDGGDPAKAELVLGRMLAADPDGAAAAGRAAHGALEEDGEASSEASRSRERAVDTLAWLGADGVNPLLELSARPGPTRLAAVRALGRMHDLSTAHRIAPLLGDPDPDVRAETAHALGEIGDQSVSEELSRCLADSVYEVRRAAQAALHRMAGGEPTAAA
jgi:HEAT repeat protein